MPGTALGDDARRRPSQSSVNSIERDEDPVTARVMAEGRQLGARPPENSASGGTSTPSPSSLPSAEKPSTPMEGYIQYTNSAEKPTPQLPVDSHHNFDPLAFHQPIIIVPAKVSKRDRESGKVIKWISLKYLTGFWLGAFYDVSRSISISLVRLLTGP